MRRSSASVMGMIQGKFVFGGTPTPDLAKIQIWRTTRSWDIAYRRVLLGCGMDSHPCEIEAMDGQRGAPVTIPPTPNPIRGDQLEIGRV